MTGRYEIELYNNRVHYFLTVERNITIIQGDSATGKSELLRLLTLYQNNGVSSGITLICDRKCEVLDNAHWQQTVKEATETIFFADEGSSFLRTREFAQSVRGSDNYFVLVTRESLPQLPYSITEIYGMRMDNSSRYHNARRTYNELYRLYHLDATMKAENIELILVEDSNSGFEFYKDTTVLPVLSAEGKSKILAIIDQNSEKQILAIVDGAAFGPEMARLMNYFRDTGSHAVLYAPESFEYLILRADIIDHTSKVTEETYLYADSRLYMSWEEFYTEYLRKQTHDTIYRYSKSKLNSAFLTKGNVEKIRNQMPVYVKKCLSNDDDH